MTGIIEVSYIVEDLSTKKEIPACDIISSELVQKAIIKELGGKRNSKLFLDDVSGKILMSSRSESVTFEIEKNDYADALTLAEEDAKSKKMISGNKVVTIINLKTKDI